MKKEKNVLDRIVKADIDYEKLGERIRVKRLLGQMKQNTLGSMVGVNCNHISNIERGKGNISLGLICKIAKVFDCTVDELLFGEGINSKKQMGYFNVSSSYDQRMLEDMLQSLKNNRKYLSEDDIS